MRRYHSDRSAEMRRPIAERLQMTQALDVQVVTACIRTLVEELMRGPSGGGSWILDARSPGLIARLRSISEQDASRVPPGGGATIAGHVAHVAYALDLLNRWARGEDAFAGADWSASWEPRVVDRARWLRLVDALDREARHWSDALKAEREWSEVTLTGAMSSAAHIAFHMGELRVLERMITSGGYVDAEPRVADSR